MGLKQNISVTIDIGANISQVRTAANEMQSILSGINLDKGASSKLTTMFNDLNRSLSDLEVLSGKSMRSLGDTRKVETAIGKVQSIMNSLSQEFSRMGMGNSQAWIKLTDGLAGKLDAAERAQRKYTQSIAETNAEQKKLESARDSATKKATSTSSNLIKTQTNYNKALDDARRRTEELKKVEEERDNLVARGQKEKTQISAKRGQITKFIKANGLEGKIKDDNTFDKRFNISPDVQQKYGELIRQLQELEAQYNKTSGEIEKANDRVDKATTANNAAGGKVSALKIQLKGAEEEAQKAAQKLTEASTALTKFNASAKNAAAFDELKNELAKTFGDETIKSIDNIDELNARVDQLSAAAAGKVKAGIEAMAGALRTSNPALKEAGDKASEAGRKIGEMTSKSKDLDMLSSRFRYFFGVMGGFQLFKRAIRGAVETIKELDAAMTQTAVVSTKTVGQMWKTLPEYSKKAKELAASMKDVYSAQTLYVQQGLSMDAALNLGVETLKMARVAGIDASTATDSMTAALRGFKMELNEVSAIRINDVYSKLAQNTASNVQEISTAMSKVASLASNANMSFENTAAYLSKIIETTREGAETAGTALKTVIARFSEVKKLYSEGELTGTTEEGEEVDVNKIAKALREVGINMNEYFTGAVGLDTIFGELGKKWNSLTTVQQRYIATMAAGSRQQSRFIALMQDWERTTELMNMAYNSEGSGQEQFEKTLDSLDAKITKLKTEWQSFIMGIANNEIVKWAVDTGTTILSTINEIIDKLSGGDGLAKAVLSVVGAFAAFKGVGAIVKGVFGNIGVALGTRAAGSVGIGAGLVGRLGKAKTTLSAMPGLMPTIGRYNSETGKWIGINKKGRANRLNMANLSAAREQAEETARVEYDAYQKEKASLANLQSDSGRKAWAAQRQAAIKNGTITGEAAAQSEQEAYENAIRDKEAKVNTAKTNYDNATEQASTITEQQVGQLQAYGAALQGIGVAAGIAAGAIYLLANHLEQGNESQQKWAKGLKGVGSGLTALSMGMMLVGTISQIASSMIVASAKAAEQGIKISAKGASTAIKAIPILGWIAAAISLVITLVNVIRNLTEQKPEEEVWKEFEEGCEKAVEEAKKVQDAYKDALSKIKDISAKEAKLDELVYGTEEWNTAVQELNESILALVQLYPALAGAVEYVNDHLILNTQSQVYKDWLKEQQRIARHAGIVEKASTYGKGYEGARRDTKNTLETGLKQRYIQDEVLLGSGQAKLTGYSELKDYNFILENGKIAFNPEEVKKFYKEDYLGSEYLYNGQFYKPGTYFATSQSTDSNIHLSSGGYHAAYVDAFEYLYLAELMGGELPFLAESVPYWDKNGEVTRGDLLEYANAELSSYGLTKEDMQKFYKDISNPLAEAINSGEVSDMASAYIFLQDWIGKAGKEYQQNGKDVLDYFKNLWTMGDSFDQNIPLAVLLQSYSKIAGAQKDLAGSSLGIRQEEVEKLKIPKEWINAYLKYGETAFLKAFENVQDSDIVSRNSKNGPDWATYAAARGIENTEENYKENEEQFKLYLRYLIAAEETYSNDAFKEFDTTFRNLEKSTKGAAKLIASGDIKSLTVEQIDIMRGEDFNKDFFEEYFGIDTEKITGQYDNLFNGLDEDIQTQIKNIATTWGETQSLISGYNRAQATGVENAGETFLGNIETIYDLINNITDPDKLKEARDILTSIDWTNTDSINKAIRELDKLGVTVDSVLVKELAKATGAVSNFNAKSLEEKVEQLETARSAGDKIKEGKTSVTGKEYKALLETAFSEYNKEGRNWSADWVQVGLDEWVYIGNETNALLSSIDSSVAALLQNTIAEKQRQVAEGKKVKGLLTGEEIEEKEEQVDQGKETEDRLNGESSKDGLIKSGGATGFNTLSMPMRLNIGAAGAILGANIEGTDLGGSGHILVDDNNKEVYGPQPAPSPKEMTFKYIDKENGEEEKEVTGAEDFARMIMAEGATAADFNADSLIALGEILDFSDDQLAQAPEQLFETLRLALEDWYNLPTNETILGQSKELLSAMMAQNSSNQQLLGQANTYNDDEQAKQERTTAAGILQGRIQSEEIEGTYEVMKEQGQQWAEEHEQKLFDENDPQTLEQMNNGYKALALTSNEAVKNIDNLNSAMSDNWDAFKKATKGTPAYTAALNKLLPALRKVFGNKVDSKWIEDHGPLLDKWAKGGEEAEEALSELAKEASKEVAGLKALDVEITTTAGDTYNLADKINELDGSQLEVGATANFGNLNNQLQMTHDQAEAAAAALNTIPGTSVTWVKTGEIHNVETGYFQITRNGAAGSTPSKGGGGGGGGKDFKNDFDKYYNQVEDINELIRLRNLLETDYNQLLEAEGTSGKQIYDNLKKQVDLLKERQKLTADLAEKRKGQIFDLLNDEEYKDVKQYAWWNEEDQTIEIDWDAINKIKDSKTGDKVKELVQKLEDFQSKYDEQIEALEEIEDALEDIRKRGRDEYISLEERLRDALIAKIQEQIDELSATNEAIDTANSNLMDSIQKALDQQRQERENEKTEEELADKEQRLAYLQQDSSGANQVEIEKLQKELDETRENYTDQLIDQKISELQEQNDEAAQQRQEQIDLMQQSLDWQEKNGEFWEQAYQILEQSIGPDGSLLKGSELEQLLKSSDAWQGLSAEGKMKWLEELEKMVAQATGYLSLSRQLEDIGTKAGKKITFTNAEGKTLTGVVDENGNVVVTDKNGNKITYKDVYQDYFGKYHTLESEKDAKTEKKPVTSSPQPQEPGSPSDTGPKYTGSDYEYINDQTCMEHKHYSDGSTINSAGGHNIVNEVCKKCGHSFKKKTGGCFAAGTKIIMSDFTTKNIEDVLIGDEVIAYNEEKELFESKKVTKSYKHYNTLRVIKVILSNNVVLKITPGHPILTTEGWKSRDIENSLYEHNTVATWLNIGDQVVGYSGIVVVENIVEMEIPNNYITYNIEVEVCHTYLADGIVVHNRKVEGAYATGGLNTETGPAWLDGTKSHPELVLNARDTENFIQLKDHLATLRQMSTNGLLGAGGDNYYDIKVQVDSLGSDYDVDMAIDRIKARIYQDSAYRNVNTLNRLR